MVEFSKESHRPIKVTCESQCSPKCYKTYVRQYREIVKTKNRNNGKIICLQCSRTLKYSGRNNPNTKYKQLDDNFFNNIDTEAKAYLLGWILSDGHVKTSGFEISIHKKDKECLKILRNIICPDIPIKKAKDNMILLSVSSQQISKDLCRWLKIVPGKKSGITSLPELDKYELTIACIRGIFDGDGCVSNPYTNKCRHPKVSISSISAKLKEDINNFIKIPSYITKTSIGWEGNNGLDFLFKIYNKANYYLDRKYELYCVWSNYIPSLRGQYINYIPHIKCSKVDKNAVLPIKNRWSDVGYDLTIIKKIKECGQYHIYSTGLKITPDFGWYTLIYPRSSIYKSGYMLANSVGLIDRSYVGELQICLFKIDNNAPDLVLPYRIAQLVPVQGTTNVEIVEVEELSDSERGSKGFGSSGLT